MGKSYEVAATPFDGFESFNRGGLRLTTSPITVTLREQPLKDGEALAEGEITSEQLARLRAEPRVRVYATGSDEAEVMRRAAELREEQAKAEAEGREIDREPKRDHADAKLAKGAPQGQTGSTVRKMTGPGSSAE